MTPQGGPEGSQVKSRKYAIGDVRPWKPNPVKVKAITNEFQEDADDRQAFHELLALKPLRRFHRELNHSGPRQAFENLLRAYLKTHLSSNVVRIANTAKYLLEEEACVVATRHIAPGKTIENLDGWRVPLSKKELQNMVKKEKDFSVLEGTRYCPTSLLVGLTHLMGIAVS